MNQFSSFLPTPPGHRRSLQVRRLAAALLLVLAAVSALRGALIEQPRVLVFAEDVSAGQTLSDGDVTMQKIPADLMPEDALAEPSEAAGKVVTAGASAGEPVTHHRLMGSALTNTLLAGTTDEPATMVPVQLAEPELVGLLHHGDTVTIVTVAPEGTEPVVVATGARVIVADEEHTLLVALGESAARNVAAASLASPLAVMLTGDRAGPGDEA